MRAARWAVQAAGEQGAAGPVALLALALCHLVMLAGALAGAPWPFLVAAAASYLLDAHLVRTSPSLARLLTRNQLGLAFRFLVRELLLVVLLMTATPVSGGLALTLAAAVLAVHVARATYTHLSRQARLRGTAPMLWRNLDVPGAGPVPREIVPPAVRAGDGVRQILHLDVVAVVGATLAVGVGADGAVLPLLWLLVLATPVLPVAAWLQLRRVRRGPSLARMRADVLDAVQHLRPEVLVYFSNPNSATYALNVWLPIMERLRQPTLIVLREAAHLPLMTPTSTPIVVLPHHADVTAFPTSSVQAALYPTNVIKNNPMLNHTGLRHAFINHGDSDKVSSFNPVCRVFDEIWVAGQAGLDRYLSIDEGIREEQIHVVGRPQLAEISRVDRRVDLADDPALTVLYAPTWEGFFDDSDYSSLELMGPALVRALLASPTRVRLLFKPHPATGTRRPAAARALREVERLVRSTAGGHRVVEPGPGSLYDAFNEADVLLSDVSSVITDFLASHKPYMVTNPRGSATEDFRSAYPVTRGGYLLAPDCEEIDAFLADITGVDRLRGVREQMAVHLLGDDGRDPVERFLDAVDGIVARNGAGPEPAAQAAAAPDVIFAEPDEEASAGAEDGVSRSGGDGGGAGGDGTGEDVTGDDGAGVGDAGREGEGSAGDDVPVPERRWRDPDIASDQAVLPRTDPRTMGRFAAIGLSASVAGMAVAAAAPHGVSFAVLALGAYSLDAYLQRRRPVTTRVLSRAGAGVTFRALLRHVLLVVLLMRSGAFDPAVIALVVVALLGLHGARALTTSMLYLGARRRTFAVGWRNLEVAGLDLPAALPELWRTDVARKVLLLDVPVLLAVALVGTDTAVVAGVVLMALGAVAFGGAAAQQLVTLRHRPDPETVVQSVLESIGRRRPRVALYFSGPAADTHLLNAWLPVVNALPQGVVVIVRQRTHLEGVASDTLPVLFLPRGDDVERFHLPSLRLALYPGTSGRNNHLLRLMGIKDVLVGSGVDTHRPVSRVYDQIWVEDARSRDSLLADAVGVRPDQVREVGWPRMVGVHRAEPGERASRPLTVLYAPTCEAGPTEGGFSSVGSMGRGVIDGLLAMSPLVRVLFRPHPATGTRRPSLAATVGSLEQVVVAAGGAHAVVPRTDALAVALNEADVVVTDVSPAVTECLQADKPFVVTNPQGLPPDEVTARHPTAAGGHLLAPDGAGLGELVRDAAERDPLGPRRREVALRLLGPATRNPAEEFERAVAELVGQPATSR